MADFFDTTVDYLIDRTDEAGNNLKMSSTDLLLKKYRQLDDKEKKCVSVIVDTFYNEKNKTL